MWTEWQLKTLMSCFEVRTAIQGLSVTLWKEICEYWVCLQYTTHTLHSWGQPLQLVHESVIFFFSLLEGKLPVRWAWLFSASSKANGKDWHPSKRTWLSEWKNKSVHELPLRFIYSETMLLRAYKYRNVFHPGELGLWWQIMKLLSLILVMIRLMIYLVWY